ncbi:MAG: hypothetical protein J0L63_00910 [Anaerolineae bacterium]|nr:hypothetical protein [Anaerolineae bacterium]MBN8617430.1 hypothetical protein [Anaerolineae bacterium]
MLDQLSALEFFALAEQNNLRAEAMEIFERCLTEGTPIYLEEFIQSQLWLEPPPLDLLQGLAQDVHQRLITLRETHFDVRNRLISEIQMRFAVDLAPLFLTQDLDTYQQVEMASVFAYVTTQYPDVTPESHLAIKKYLSLGLANASQISSDVALVRDLLDYLLDWLDALSISLVHYTLRRSYYQAASTSAFQH